MAEPDGVHGVALVHELDRQVVLGFAHQPLAEHLHFFAERGWGKALAPHLAVQGVHHVGAAVFGGQRAVGFDAACERGRIKDKLHRPTFVFAASSAPGKAHELKGSGRSIPGFHLRDALDLVAKRHPGVLLKFGGHAMAAGCTVAEEAFDVFEQALAQVAREWLDAAALTRRIETDGPLAPEYCRADMVDTLHHEVWGQGFAPPTFSEEVQVLSQRLVGEGKNHLSIKLIHQGNPIDAIWFSHTEPLPARVLLAFRLDVNEWKGERKVQFLVEGAQL